MKKTRFTFALAVLITAAVSLAQGPRGPQNQNLPSRPAVALAMSRIQTVTGAVSAVSIAYGTQYPSITVGGKVIKVAPAWFLLEKDFEIKVGDHLSVVAAPSAVLSDAYLYAIEIANLNTKARIALRDSSGAPLWTGRHGGGARNSDAPRYGSGCIDPATIGTVTGTVEEISMGVGIQMPTLLVKTWDGELISMKLGPERILLEADFELMKGEPVTAKYAHEACTDENVALQLTNAAGVTVILRNDDGTPAWN